MRNYYCRKRLNKGITLIELVVALTLFVIVASLGFSLYFFGTQTFNIGLKRSTAQDDVNIIAERVTKEVRYAKALNIIDPSMVPAAVTDDYSYIFINSSNLVEFRDRDNDIVLPSGDIGGASFTLSFESKGSGKILSYTVSMSGDQGFNIVSELYLMNISSAINGTSNTAIAYK